MPAEVQLRAGVDLIATSDVADSIAAHGSRYLGRVYDARELEGCRRQGEIDPGMLGERFAAKEAVLKLLGLRDEAVPLRDVVVLGAAAPVVELRGAARRVAAERGLRDVSVATSRAGTLALGVAVGTVPG